MMDSMTTAVTTDSSLAVDATTSSWNMTNTTLPFDASCYHSWPTNPSVMTSLRVYFSTSLILVVVGLAGNALSIIVFSSREMRCVSSNVYLLSLAVSDSMYLVSVLLYRLLVTARCWFFPALEADIANHSTFWCVALQYANDLFSDYSTCLILAFTVERGLAVFRPITYKERCTVARARCVCVTMFVVIAALIAPYHVIMMGVYHEYQVCVILPAHDQLFAAFYIAELVSLRVVPVVAIALLNTLIVVRVTSMTREKNRRRRQLTAQQQSRRALANGAAAANGNGAHRGDVYELVPDGRQPPGTGSEKERGGSRGSLGGTGSGGGTGIMHLLHRHKKQKRRASLDERNLQLTIVLILVSSTYILSYLPVLVIFVLQNLKRSELISATWDQLTTYSYYANPLHVAGFAINFFLYTVSGRVFRDQMLAIVCGRRQTCCRKSVGGGGVPGGVGSPSAYAHASPLGGTSSTNAGEPTVM